MMVSAHPEHCTDCAAAAVALDDAALRSAPRAAVADCARLDRPRRKGQYRKRLRWNLKRSPKERTLPRLDPVVLPS